MNKEKKVFLQSISNIEIDEQRKSMSLNRINKDVLQCKTEEMDTDWSVWKFVTGWLDKKVLLINVIFIIVEMFIVGIMLQCEISRQAMRSFLTILPVGSGLLSILGLNRIFYSKVAELSETCFFNVKQMLGIELIAFSSLNLLYLLILSMCTTYQWQESFLYSVLYIVVPYIVSVCCYLGVLLTEAGRKNSYLIVVMGIFLIVFYGIISSIPILYVVSMQFLWRGLLIVSILSFAVLIKIFLRKVDKGEIVCMN